MIFLLSSTAAPDWIRDAQVCDTSVLKFTSPPSGVLGRRDVAGSDTYMRFLKLFFMIIYSNKLYQFIMLIFFLNKRVQQKHRSRMCIVYTTF